MEETTPIVFLILIFATVFMLSQLILVPTFGTRSKESRLLKQRLKKLSSANLNNEISLVRENYFRNLSPLNKWLSSIPGANYLEDLIEQAGKTYLAYRVLLIMLVLSIFTGILVWIFTFNIYATIVATFFAGWIPVIKLKSDRTKRLDLFEEQLPEALDMMSRALRSGYPFNDAMHYIGEEMPDPIGTEFRITFEEINYGRNIKQAFNYLIMRIPSTNLVSVTTAIIIQRETGGNLAELLDKISDLLRKRFRFQRRVKTLTAEGRLSAWVLALLPFFFFIAMYLSTPSYIQPLLDTKDGNNLLIIGVVLQVIGAFWVRKQINFDI